MWRVRYIMKRGEISGYTINASGYIEHTDGRVVCLESSSASNKEQMREMCQNVVDALNYLERGDAKAED